MPYLNNTELPDNIKNVLPAAAQTVFRNVVNSVLARKGTEESAFKQAWGALANQGWKKGQNGKWMRVGKEFSIDAPFQVLKKDEDKREVYGWFSVITKDSEPVVDSQGHIIPLDVLKSAARGFLAEYRLADDRHQAGTEVGELIDSIVLDVEIQKVLGIDLKKEGWFGGFRVTNDEVWQKIKNQEYLAFSIGGIGILEDVE